jgi:hypothetical protein
MGPIRLGADLIWGRFDLGPIWFGADLTCFQIDSTSLHLLFQRNFTLLNVINYQDFLYDISLPDIHLDLVFINDVLIYQTLCPITLILQLLRYHRKPFLGGTSALS